MTHWWARLLVESIGLLLFAGVYAAGRFGISDLRRWERPLTVLGFVLAIAWVFCEVTNRDRFAYLFQGNFWGIWAASLWIRRYYKLPDGNTITTLNLSSTRE